MARDVVRVAQALPPANRSGRKAAAWPCVRERARQTKSSARPLACEAEESVCRTTVKLTRAVLMMLMASLAGAQTTLKVRIQPSVSQSTTGMTIERYVAAAVAGESAIFRSDEALKAMAVTARTYAIRFRGRHASEGYDLCGTTHCQRLDPAGMTPHIEAAVAATAGELLWYDDKPIFAAHSRNCGGVTEDASAVWSEIDVPYLRSHPDPYCRRDDSVWRWSAPAREIADLLRKSELRVPAEMTGLGIARRTASGRVRELALTGNGETIRLAASSFRFAIGRAAGFNTIRSDRWEVTVSGGRVAFEGMGEGHGVGLCQNGADQMGIEGRSYREILAFYFPGALVSVTPWSRLRGEIVTMLSMGADQDRAVLALAEREVRDVARRTGLQAPPSIELRVYPDVESFRNATAEPGWVAAHTTGARIDLQPAATLRARGVLESTLRHEIVHVFLETQAAPGLPVWFREGLAAYLSDGPSQPGGSTGSEIRTRTDEAQARRANAAAAARVSELVRREGLPQVISWLRSGMPK
jgi:stage II sporulation protein D